MICNCNNFELEAWVKRQAAGEIIIHGMTVNSDNTGYKLNVTETPTNPEREDCPHDL